MENLLSNIFSMRFDILVPLSFILVALVVSFLLFFMRFLSYNRAKKKFAKTLSTQKEIDPVLLKMLEIDPKYPEKIENTDKSENVNEPEGIK